MKLFEISSISSGCCLFAAELDAAARAAAADVTAAPHLCASVSSGPFFNPAEIIPELIQSERRPSDADATTGFAKYLIIR